MIHWVCLFDGCCLYEVMALCYFLQNTHKAVKFCSPDGRPVRSAEGFRVEVDGLVSDIALRDTAALLVPGGTVANLRSNGVLQLFREAKQQGILLAAICAGVDLLDEAGVLTGLRSTHSVEEDCVTDGTVITARANAYIDFAVAVGKALDLFRDARDLRETVEFWKYHRGLETKA